jgi:hypothetical protein
MASVTKSPGTMADSADVGTVAWTNPDNAKVSDGVYADVTFNPNIGISHYLKATNFGFLIPSGATINGILVEIEMKRAINCDFDDKSIKIIKANGLFGSQEKKRDDEVWWPDTDTYISYGSSSDLWGETWTKEDIENINFGIGISTESHGGESTTHAYIDHIRITVYYTGEQKKSPLPIFFQP